MNVVAWKFRCAQDRVMHEIRFALPTAPIFIIVLAIVTRGFTAHFVAGAILTLCWIPAISLLACCYVLLWMAFLRWGPRRLPPLESIPAGIRVGPRKPAPLAAHVKPPGD